MTRTSLLIAAHCPSVALVYTSRCSRFAARPLCSAGRDHPRHPAHRSDQQVTLATRRRQRSSVACIPISALADAIPDPVAKQSHSGPPRRPQTEYGHTCADPAAADRPDELAAYRIVNIHRSDGRGCCRPDARQQSEGCASAGPPRSRPRACTHRARPRLVQCPGSRSVR
jgi:hypothetical protein